MPKMIYGASAKAPLLVGRTAGEPIPGLMRDGQWQLNELEISAELDVNHHEKKAESRGYRNGNRILQLTTQERH